MRRLIALLLFLSSVIILCLSSSDLGMRWITHTRYARNDAWGADKYRYGDLYGLSYLSDFRILQDTNKLALPSQVDTLPKSYDLTILGDSYLYSFFHENPAYFNRVSSVNLYRWSDTMQHLIRPKSKNKQVLLIECVERNMWARVNLADARLRLDVQKSDLPKVGNNSLKDVWLSQLDRFDASVRKALYHPSLESNLDFVLFNWGLLGPIKELKADFIWHVLGRTNPDVQVSQDAQFLYLRETVDVNSQGSSFRSLNKEEIDQMVQKLNEIQAYYLRYGFDEVIISLIPNPVSILATENGSLNRAIPQIKEHPALKVKFLDPTSSLKKGAELNFSKSDSHWTLRGAQIWLNDLNQILNQLP
ncbi:hypothetical protein [Aquirufa rosea]|uniref:AlgX/AlgJ SGNH hydrolase-like domain-containing protein n=1 Tax=Aquirufa rosea TaxID=2509241 RepID=A0A4Q1C036_9BACT|nr:hypothetical protein [Aquirufa rosea]RXK49663.1 hypothetical protein ESB04_05670 [Aquirufa rosea]